MHSHEQTKLAQFGFADPDKKDSRHDLAVQYLVHVKDGVLGNTIKKMFDIEEEFYSIIPRFEECITKGHHK